MAPTVDDLKANLTQVAAEYERLEAADRPHADDVRRLLAFIDAQIDTWARLCVVLARDESRDLTAARAAARGALPRLAWLRAQVLPLELAARRGA